MIRFLITDEDTLELVKNDRGNWQLISDNEQCVYVYSGFGSENILTIMLAGMQDGTVSIMTAHSPCDSPIWTMTRVVHRSQAEKALNEMVGMLLDYPEEL